MTVNLKIEIIKVFKLEFELSSDKKKGVDSAKETVDTKPADAKQSSASK